MSLTVVFIAKEGNHRRQEIGFVGEQEVAFDLGVDLIRVQSLKDLVPLPLSPKERRLIKLVRALETVDPLEPRPPPQYFADELVVIAGSVGVELEHRLVVSRCVLLLRARCSKVGWHHLVRVLEDQHARQRNLVIPGVDVELLED
eukprot:CAMPEP_0170510922 /NCGR_PEP_ID=MMETSP0208-20121228/66025_1 /TAXON_ID=197538 /ORGANISM="Strombidium inclinatum, Strain S3" /LENGTH=144 /DNA_ID=CAMNT_0010794417 /DNA_START=1439 /DNA_END=1873 /DNA_ORIENTATION=-